VERQIHKKITGVDAIWWKIRISRIFHNWIMEVSI
jgi:hypothetical protein